MRRPATKGDVLVWGRARHAGCGGAVSRELYDYGHRGPPRCEKCAAIWNEKAIDRFGVEDLALRFYVDVAAEDTGEVLVWVNEPASKVRHTALVPKWKADAEKLERVIP